MFDFLLKSPAWQLIVQSDWMTKVVLLILMSVSILCIAIVFFKFKILKKQRLELQKISKKFKSVNNFNELLQITKKYKNTIGGNFLENNLKNLKNILEERKDKKISIKNIEYLELVADQYIDEIIIEAETYLPILGTSAAVSPLMGLFGTVWGLIHSFVNISQEKSADIAVVAPGIAEALTTTLAGLIVAIPAMIAFNYFSNELRKQEQQLLHITNKYLNIVKQTYLK